MNQTTRRRFIAGAVCPRCGQMDKIAIDVDGDCRFCVSCGFSEARPGQARPGQARRPDTPAQVLTVVDPRREDGED